MFIYYYLSFLLPELDPDRVLLLKLASVGGGEEGRYDASPGCIAGILGLDVSSLLLNGASVGGGEEGRYDASPECIVGSFWLDVGIMLLSGASVNFNGTRLSGCCCEEALAARLILCIAC
jgi:hypothetical protein